MSNLCGKFGAIFLPTGPGTEVNAERIDVLNNENACTAHMNVKVHKVATDYGGINEIDNWKYTTDGCIKIKGSTVGQTFYVWYNYWATGVDLVEIGSFYDWSISISCNPIDCSDFGTNNEYKKYTVCHSEVTATAKQHFVSEELLYKYIIGDEQQNNEPFICKFFISDTDRNDTFFSGLFSITGLSTDVKVDDVVGGELNFSLGGSRCGFAYIGCNLLLNNDFSEGTTQPSEWTLNNLTYDNVNNRILYPESTSQPDGVAENDTEFQIKDSSTYRFFCDFDFLPASDRVLNLAISVYNTYETINVEKIEISENESVVYFETGNSGSGSNATEMSITFNADPVDVSAAINNVKLQQVSILW